MIEGMSKNNKHPVPTGNPWQPSKDDPATVPVPLPVIIVKVEGPYTERDRKLWTFLLHAVWDEIPEDPQEEKLVIHELPITKINQVFRECGGDHNSKWIWESAKRLAKTTVEWEDEEYEGIENLLNARITKQARASGVLYFHFPAMLTPRIKKAKRFARLRTHFMLGLSGKYAVTLYELLESIANKNDPILDVPYRYTPDVA
jgi:Initiator Replication protein